MSTIVDGIKEILQGFARKDPAGLANLLVIQDWDRIAEQELERRATIVVQSLDDESLGAIASGEVDLQAICRDIADDLNRPR
jgi:hypothetical protein